MKDVSKYRVGDKIVHFGRIYTIFKMSFDKSLNEHILYYKPYYKGRGDDTLICSIPTKNIAKTNIRKPISRNKAKKIFINLSKRCEYLDSLDSDVAKSIIGQNKPRKLAETLKHMWYSKNTQEVEFSRTKEKVFELLVSRLSEELAFSAGITPEEASKKIITNLKKAY